MRRKKNLYTRALAYAYRHFGTAATLAEAHTSWLAGYRAAQRDAKRTAEPRGGRSMGKKHNTREK